MSKILVICAHPDDETLGMGGTIAWHVSKKDQVYVIIMADGQFLRDQTKKGIAVRQDQAKKACSHLGVKKVYFLNYPDQKLDTFPLSEISNKLANLIKKINPTTVYTHFWGDVNQDHRYTFDATLIATRPLPSSKIEKLICFETPSSTEWGYPHQQFSPNLFVDVKRFMDKKLKAFSQYKFEIEKYPHPRSKESLISRSKYWGSLNGIENAESFYIVREHLK